MDIGIQAQLMSIDDLAEAQAAGYAKNYSTAAELWEAANPDVKNRASEHIEAGRESFLVSRDAIELGVHPFIAIHDVAIKRDGTKVGIDTARSTKWVAPETLIAWR
jgi:hypothetical protein